MDDPKTTQISASIDVTTGRATDVNANQTTSDHDEILRLARYPIIRKIGEGGMGVVYACYDESLDRRIAVKLLNSRFQARSARTRLEREAQALARLSHPNVVQIYEIGVHRDDVYLAMEFVDGQTLRAWLAARGEHRWQAIVEVLLQAGRGLAAAHAAGLIHRDFKPDNVMVGRDGRVRVLDFGLVQSLPNHTLEREDQAPVNANNDGSLRPLALGVTRAGAIVGTPAYMAPEQHEGRACDAKTDQFALCVVAYEALFGTRPYVGESFTSIAAAVRAGRIQPGVNELGVPRRVRAAIVRGLAGDPEQRWAKLDDLLDELGSSLAGAKRRWLAGGALILALAVSAGVWFVDAGAQPGPSCAFDGSALAGVWDEPRRASIRAAFTRQTTDADPTLRLVEAGLDRWANDWIASQRDACEATWVRGRQSEATLDKRMGCLDRQRRAFAVVTELLADADAELVARSPALLASLPDLDACTDAERVEQRYAMPDDPARAEAIAAGFEDLARARALATAGRLSQADAQVEALLASTPDYPPLDLEIRGLAGERQLWHGQRDQGLAALLDAARAAEVLHLDDLVASLKVRAAIDAAGTWGHPQREQWLLADAEAAVDRLARVDDPRRLELHGARGWLHEAAGDASAALAEFRAALAFAERIGQSVRAEQLRVHVARMLANLGRHEQAALEFEAARLATERSLGPGAPSLAEVELDIGLFAAQRGRMDEAAAHLERARTILLAAFGDDPNKLARVNLAQGKLALSTGDLEGAREWFTAVVAATAVPPEWQADAHEALGVLEFYAEDFHASLEAYARALELRARELDEDHPKMAILHSNIGESKAALDDHAGALAAYSRAITALERSLPAGHFDLAFPLKGRGQSRLELGQAQAARVDLEAALALHQANPGEPLERADVEFSAARALAAVAERSRSSSLAEQARARYVELGQTERAEAIERWLRQIEQ